jgi:hypothetical protein
MRKTIFAVAAMMALAGCTTAEQDATVGGLAGAGIGALATGDAGGAIVGGVVGRCLRRADRQGDPHRLVPLSRQPRPHLRGSLPLIRAAAAFAAKIEGYPRLRRG